MSPVIGWNPNVDTAASTLQFSVRLFAALLLGGMVGLEREWRQRMAGTRTNALVAGGAAAFVMVAELLPGDTSAAARMASYVISGIGFLGAGVIFKEGMNVRGLNTAATIWCSAGIGLLAGVGAFERALVLAIGVILVNAGLRPLHYKLSVGGSAAGPGLLYQLSFTCMATEEVRLRCYLLACVGHLSSATLQSISSEDIEGSDRARIRAEIVMRSTGSADVEKIVGKVSHDPAVMGLSWALLPRNAME